MSIDTMSTMSEQRIAAMVRQHEVEQFLHDEAALLDARHYEDRLALFADDARYFMPIRRTRLQKEVDQEFTQPGEMASFNDTKPLLAGRVTKLLSGRSCSEDPPSRTRRLVTNVRVMDDDGQELTVASNFLLYRTRLNSLEDKWIGSSRDVLRRAGASFRDCRPHDLPRRDRRTVAQPQQLLLMGWLDGTVALVTGGDIRSIDRIRRVAEGRRRKPSVRDRRRSVRATLRSRVQICRSAHALR
jgi:biphenyl 2,3-dioxygenase beta subunit